MYFKKLIVYYKNVQKIITILEIIMLKIFLIITIIYHEVKKIYRNCYGRTNYSDYRLHLVRTLFGTTYIEKTNKLKSFCFLYLYLIKYAYRYRENDREYQTKEN